MDKKRARQKPANYAMMMCWNAFYVRVPPSQRCSACNAVYLKVQCHQGAISVAMRLHCSIYVQLFATNSQALRN